jgi:hypothetical protein
MEVGIMSLSETKSIVAQNCSLYIPYNPILQMSMTGSSQSCSNCSNFIKGECTAGEFPELSKKIKIN